MTRAASPLGPGGGGASRAQVVVLAKHPIPGAVKTRLAAAIGAEPACRLYRAFILDLAGRLADSALPVTWAFWPPDAPFAALVAPAPCLPQVAGDLGARLDAAMRACFAQRRVPVIALGADAPQLEIERLHEAAAALAGGADVVLGPALDGGYYLIALGAPDAHVFSGIPWGTGGVLEATLARARERGLRVRLLPPTFDVDEVAGLTALRALVDAGAVDLPHTVTALREIETPATRGRTS